MNLLQIIEENSNDRSGISIVELAVKANLSIPAVKQAINGLHLEGKVKVREGINQKLIFLNN